MKADVKLMQRKIYVNITFSNLGLMTDSSIAKWETEGYNEAIIDNFGLNVIEKGHQDA